MPLIATFRLGAPAPTWRSRTTRTSAASRSCSPVFTRSPEEAIACTDELMEVLGCKTVADLKAVDVKDLLEATAVVLQLRIWAERDGRFLPEDPYGEYARGAVRDVDVLQGCNKDEMGLFINSFGLKGYDAFAADRYAKKMAQLTEGERALAEGFCADARDVTETYSSKSRLFDQIVFIATLFRLSEDQTKAGGRSYTYFFTPESANPLIRCGHGAETPSVFGIPEDIGVTGRAYDATFSRTLRNMWVQFARTGDPSLPAEAFPDGKEKVWPAYDLADRQVMFFDEFDVHVEREAERGILDWDRTYFLTKYYYFLAAWLVSGPPL